MSKSTKKSAKKPKEAAAPKKELVTQLADDDRMILKIKVLERNNAQLALQNLQQQLQATYTAAQEAQTGFAETITTINTKYGLNPEKDKIDINTGVITRE